LTEIVKGVDYVDGSNANCYLVASDGGLTLIDTGMQKDGGKILEFLASSLKRDPSGIKTIVLTHCHVDHVRGAAAIKSATGGSVATHEAEAGYVSGDTPYPSPKGGTGMLFRAVSPFFRVERVRPDVILKEGDLVGGLKVIHTPGHTPGSIALLREADGVLFVGDTVRYMKGKLEGPPSQFTLSMDDAKASIEKMSQYSFEVVLSGHGEPLKSKEAPKMLRDLSARL
jgi:glyoxylase-like metal-dependent hydrolase (beta-lactamase superfamily II)